MNYFYKREAHDNEKLVSLADVENLIMRHEEVVQRYEAQITAIKAELDRQGNVPDTAEGRQMPVVDRVKSLVTKFLDLEEERAKNDRFREDLRDLFPNEER